MAYSTSACPRRRTPFPASHPSQGGDVRELLRVRVTQERHTASLAHSLSELDGLDVRCNISACEVTVDSVESGRTVIAAIEQHDGGRREIPRQRVADGVEHGEYQHARAVAKTWMQSRRKEASRHQNVDHRSSGTPVHDRTRRRGLLDRHHRLVDHESPQQPDRGDPRSQRWPRQQPRSL
jgi:hypothetical protein